MGGVVVLNKYVTLNKLKVFLDNLKITFSDISHTHTKNEITDFDIQEIVEEVKRQLPAAEEGEF